MSAPTIRLSPPGKAPSDIERIRNFSPLGFSNRASAFTLLELIIVMVILGIIFMVSVPRFRSTHDYLQLQSIAGEISNLSRYVREKAILRRTTYRLNFEKSSAGTNKARLFVTYKENNDFSIDEKRMAIEVPKGIDLRLDDNGNTIDFYIDGTMQKKVITLTSGARKIALPFSSNRGFILPPESDEPKGK